MTIVPGFNGEAQILVSRLFDMLQKYCRAFIVIVVNRKEINKVDIKLTELSSCAG